MDKNNSDDLVRMMIEKYNDFADRYIARSMSLAIMVIIINQFKPDTNTIGFMGLSLSSLGHSNIIGFLGLLCFYFLLFTILNAYVGMALWIKHFGVPSHFDDMPVTRNIQTVLFIIVIIIAVCIYSYTFSIAYKDMYQVVENIIKSIT